MAARYDRTSMLAHSVIRQTILDVFSKTLSGAHDNEAELERRYALRFLTDATGEWADSRNMWCQMADIDADDLRDRLIDILDGKRDIEQPEDDKTFRLSGHDIARQVWSSFKRERALDARCERFNQGVQKTREQVQKEKELAARRRAAWAEAGQMIRDANERLLFGT